LTSDEYDYSESDSESEKKWWINEWINE
jgi:hypothetical protein